MPVTVSPCERLEILNQTNQCRTRVGRHEAAKSPLWATHGKLWTGELGYSVERLQFWKERFEALSAREGTVKEARSAANRARRAIRMA